MKDAIAEGRKYGMSDDEIKSWAVEVGDYLAKNVCAGTPEEALLTEFWDIASPGERKTLANLIFRLVSKGGIGLWDRGHGAGDERCCGLSLWAQ